MTPTSLSKHLGLIIPLFSAAFTLLFAQVDVSDKVILQDVQYYLKDDHITKESTANLAFKFKSPVARYYYTTKGKKWTIDFYDAVQGQAPPNIGQLGTPFSDIKVSMTRENMQQGDGLTPTMVDILRVELLLEKGINPSPDFSSLRNFINLKATWSQTGEASPEETKFRSHLATYVVAGVSVAAIAAGIFFFTKSSDENTDEIVVR